MKEPSPEAPFSWRDATILALIFALGGLGYLCDIHSPLVLPALPFFGLFFSLALVALG
ncbi:hypothetical protein I6F37_40315, partial [Bradyrhizobium sp. NBAIM08]|nr:hypothetical protein [Bradyrhizobium sp. NBAIM08]